MWRAGAGRRGLERRSHFLPDAQLLQSSLDASALTRLDDAQRGSVGDASVPAVDSKIWVKVFEPSGLTATGVVERVHVQKELRKVVKLR
jgi:hypothetical protein